MTTSRRRRLLLRLGIAAAAIAALLAVGAWILVDTRPGMRFLLSRVGGLLPGALELGEVEGTLRGPLRIHGLRYRTDTFEMTIDAVAFDWRLRGVSRRQLDLTWLTARGVHIVTEPSEDQATVDDPLVDIDLGWGIVVRRLEVADVTVRRGRSAPTRIDRLALAGRTRGRVLQVDHLLARGPDLSLDARGDITPIGDWPLALDAVWALRIPEGPRLAGRGRIGGTVRALQLDQSLSEPARARVRGTLRHALTDLRLDGTLETEALSMRILSEEAPEGTVAGSISARGTLEDLEGTADLALVTADYGPLRAAGGWSLRGGQLALGDVAVSSDGNRLAGTLDGTIALEEPTRFSLAATWRTAAWPLRGEVDVSSRGGRAGIEGTAEAWRLTLDADVRVPDVVEGRLALEGRGTDRGLAIASARYRTLGGLVRASGRVGWEPAVTWDLSFTGEGLDPQGLVEGLPGTLAVEGRAAGRVHGEVVSGRVAPLTFRGRLLEAPIDGTAAAIVHVGERVTADALRATWGGATLAADGVVTEPMDLRWSAEVPDLAVLVPGSRGTVQGSGTVAGRYDTPRVEGTLTAQGLDWQGVGAATLELRGTAGVAASDPLAVELVATQVAVAGESFERLTVSAEGSGATHRITARAEGGIAGIELTAAGGLSAGPRWQGTLEGLSLRSEEWGTWALTQPASLDVSASDGRVQGFCWASDPGRVCADAAWAGTGTWTLDATVEDVPLERLRAFIPAGVEVNGAIDATVAARGLPDGRILGDVVATAGPGSLSYPGPEGDPVTVRFQPATLRVAATPTEVSGAAALVLDEVGTVDATVSIPGGLATAGAADRPLRAQVRAQLASIGVIQAFVPFVSQVAGRLDADVEVAGTVGRPVVSGRAALTGGRAVVPELGIELTEVEITATELDGRSMRIVGSARSGPGTVRLEGVLTPTPTAEAPIRVSIDGQRFQAAATADAQVLVSPDLEVAYTGETVVITGEVLVPQADVTVGEEEDEAVVPVSRDVVFVGPEVVEAEPEPLLAIDARVRVVLGSDVEVRGLGAEARLAGSVLVTETPGRPTSAVGEIDVVRGTYQAYGQDLQIERGRVYFAGGPIDNPGIDLRAFRRATDGVIAGIEVTGTLQQPRVELWSRPTLPETQQLSYVLLGRPLESATTQEGDLMARAATTLGVKGGNLLAGKLASRFGLEEARIEARSGRESASLFLGTYLSPRLYVSYGMGLFQPVNIFRIRYLLSEHWTLEAERGLGVSGEVVYKVERGEGVAEPTPPRVDALEPRPVPAPSEPQGE